MAELHDRGRLHLGLGASPFIGEDSHMIDIPMLSPLGGPCTTSFFGDSTMFDDRSPAHLEYPPVDNQTTPTGGALNTSTLSDNPDYELIKDMESQWHEQRVLSRETQLDLMRSAASSAAANYDHPYSDTDSSSSREYENQSYAYSTSGSSYNPYVSAYGNGMTHPGQTQYGKPSGYVTSSTYPGNLNQAQTAGARRLKRPRQQLKPSTRIPKIGKDAEGNNNNNTNTGEPPKKVSSPRRAGRKPGTRRSTLISEAQGSGSLSLSGSVASPRSVSSPAAARAEFDRTIQSLATPVLLCLVEELSRVREGKERVYIAPGARPPEQALSDERGYFVYKKVIPHQHKPERSGDPSPKCFACAARTLHDKAVMNVKLRPEASTCENFMGEENVRSAREAIVNALGLPPATRVFEYENAAPAPGPSAIPATGQ